uniref:CS domain-containing protein n=1 Tax=Rhodosorus marinus TaxID=101924 RepID=A0A7S0G9S3_9RHOD|mmetsp:Transcript_974/g.1544  ORF Transcript_974/g.1544 Transcript_974/m.1544 type:complete len:778 (+) Transcript_974:101-2434(+)
MEIEGEMVVPGTEFEEILSGGPEENGGGNYSKGDSEDDETLVPAKEVMKELEKSDLSSREDRAETEAPGENREAAEPTDVNGIDDNPTEPSESVDADPASEEGPASAEASKATESGTVKVETAATQSAEPADDAETPPSADQPGEDSKEAPPPDGMNEQVDVDENDEDEQPADIAEQKKTMHDETENGEHIASSMPTPAIAKSTEDVDAEIPASEKASSADYQALPQGNPSLNVVDHPTKNEDSDLGRTSSSSIPASTNAEKDEEESANAIHAEPASSEDKKEPAGPEEAEKPDVSPGVRSTQEVPAGEQEEAEDGPLEEEGSVEKTAAEVEALAQDSTTAPAEADIYTRGLNPEEERMLVESAIQSLLESVKSKVQEDAEMEENKSTNSKFEYSWTQNSAAVMIYIPIEAGVRAKDVTVDVSSEAGTINVKQRGRAPLLEGSLHSEVSENGLTWQIEGEDGTRAITIELEKAERKLWSMLVVGDQRDEQSPGQSTSRTSAPLDTELQATESDANEEIIELDVDKMQKANRAFADLEDGETGLEAWEEEELMRELEKEVLESAGEDRMGQDASMHSGEIPLADLLEYYKAIATGKANGVESVEMAAMQVALFYSKGIVVQQDFKEAAGWYEIAAKDKNDIAMFHLGLLYQEGLGVETDVQKAMDWWEKAADLGNANALYNLGVMYINGHGVQQDTYKAIDYFTKAKELDPSLPFPPFAEFGNSSSAPRESMPLTAEEKNQQRENSIQNLRYIFWTTTFVSVAAVTFFGVRYWWKNRL